MHEIKLIRLKSSSLAKKDIKNDDLFIDEINDSLFDNEAVLLEETSHPLLTVFFVESDDIENEYKKVRDYLVNPIIILVGRHFSALRGALELNTIMNLDGYDPLIINKREASLLNELLKVGLMRDRISKMHLALVGSDHSLTERGNVTYFYDRYHLGITKISKKEFIDAFVNTEPGNLPRSELIAKLYPDQVKQDKINRLYQVAMKFVKEYNLSGIAFSIKEFGELINPVCSILNERGISAVNEGDLYSLVSLSTLNAVSEANSIYAQISNIDFEQNSVSFVSKVAPLYLLNGDSSLAKGTITIYKISYDKKHITALEAKIVSSSLLDDKYVEIGVELEGQRIFDFINDVIGGTVAICYGDFVGVLLAYENTLRLDNRE